VNKPSLGARPLRNLGEGVGVRYRGLITSVGIPRGSRMRCEGGPLKNYLGPSNLRLSGARRTICCSIAARMVYGGSIDLRATRGMIETAGYFRGPQKSRYFRAMTGGSGLDTEVFKTVVERFNSFLLRAFLLSTLILVVAW